MGAERASNQALLLALLPSIFHNSGGGDRAATDARLLAARFSWQLGLS